MTAYSNINVTGREQYKASHGKYPRGVGNWAFQIGNNIFWSGNHSYSDAKKLAQMEAVGKNIHYIKVLP